MAAVLIPAFLMPQVLAAKAAAGVVALADPAADPAAVLGLGQEALGELA